MIPAKIKRANRELAQDLPYVASADRACLVTCAVEARSFEGEQEDLSGPSVPSYEATWDEKLLGTAFERVAATVEAFLCWVLGRASSWTS